MVVYNSTKKTSLYQIANYIKDKTGNKKPIIDMRIGDSFAYWGKVH